MIRIYYSYFGVDGAIYNEVTPSLTKKELLALVSRLMVTKNAWVLFPDGRKLTLLSDGEYNMDLYNYDEFLEPFLEGKLLDFPPVEDQDA